MLQVFRDVTPCHLASYPTPQRRVAGDFNPQQYRCENLKYCIPLSLDVVQWLAVLNAVMNLCVL